MGKAREAAARTLFEVWEKDAYANIALAQELRRTQLGDVDRRFCTELVYGTVKAKGTVDWILGRYLSRPIQKLSPMVRAILRLGIYQLFFLDRVPASAACNESVELAKKTGNRGAAGFVNAVLRTAVREPERAKFPEGKGHAMEHLALSACHPEWLVRRWVDAFGFQKAEELCRFDNREPPLSLRVNVLRTTRDAALEELRARGADAEASDWAPEGILCRSHGALEHLELLQKGFCQVQDESSMLVAHVLDPKPGEFVLDCCAAPGGKTTHIAERMENRGRVLAGDVHEHKLALIRDNAARLGISCVEPILLDGRETGARFPRQADRVLVDAPCSGLGVLRRRADARWRKKEPDLSRLPELQLAILSGAADALRPGGVLVYSTCTMEPAENREVVGAFLASRNDFQLESAGQRLPLRPREEDMVQLLPQEDGTDGFFIARMRRKGG